MRNGSCLQLASEHSGGFHLKTEEDFLRSDTVSPATCNPSVEHLQPARGGLRLN